MFNFIQKLFGKSSQRVLKTFQPYVKQINQAYEKLATLSHDELRSQTYQLQEEIKKQTAQTYNTLQELRKKAQKEENLTEKNKLFTQVDEAQKKYDQKLEKVLESILTQAFAIVKETTRRFKENKEIYVQATEYDQLLAKKYPHIKIIDDKACWQNSWRAGGQMVTWNMVPYDVQLIGGIILHQGKIAEMATGEGKTLAAILPAFLNALAQKGVHIVTVNDYLSQRDAEWVGPIYQFHGLTIDCIDKYPSHSKQRKQAYLADITYGTNNEFGFDYLRDNMVNTLQEKVQRPHHYAIIDEVDSVLIDEARTPLIISGPTTYNDSEAYRLFKPRVHQLYQAQYKLITSLLHEAQQKIQQSKTKEAGLALLRIYRGLPKYSPFIQYLSEKGMKKLLSDTESEYLEENSRKMPEADEPLFFIIEEKDNTIELTEKGIEYLTQQGEDPHFFVLPDMATEIAKIENNTTLANEEKLTQRNQLIQDYSNKSSRIHTIHQLLRAYTLFEKNVDYVVIHQQVKIVDEKTGRILVGRRYSDGLHQALEAKENVNIQEPTQTYATVTLQNYFRMYNKLAGMTGTAETEARELWDIYKLEVVVIPTHKPLIRDDKDDKIYKTKEEKLDAIAQEVHLLQQTGRPVLVGTSSVESSEEMRKKLKLSAKQVLNATNHRIESQIIAQAGQEGAITVVTHMAGRGTDIKLSPQALQAGGLAIVGAERHENRRVDRQLRGRAGRQGDPGSSQFFISIEDPLMMHFRHGVIGSQIDKIFTEKGEAIQDTQITRAIQTAQKRLEENQFAHRKRSLEYDDVMNMQRGVIYQKRDHALHGDRLQLDIMHMLHHTITHIITQAQTQEGSYKSFQLNTLDTLDIATSITEKELTHQPAKKLIKKLYEEASKTYTYKKEKIQTFFTQFKLTEETKKLAKNQSIPFAFALEKESKKPIYTYLNLAEAIESKGKTAIQTLESAIVLHGIDEHWKNHLQRMDALKDASRNAQYENKDPLLVYKFEALELFKQLIHTIHKEVITLLFKIDLVAENLSQADQSHLAHPSLHLQESKQTYEEENQDIADRKATTPIQSTKIASRNQRVSVKYTDGSIKENVKFKTVEEDVKNKLCVII